MDPKTKIASRFTVEAYHSLRPHLDPTIPGSPAWDIVIQAFKRRLLERFFRPIEALQCTSGNSRIRAGFSILALDCLLIDTLQSFREGRTTGRAETKASFESFLRSAPFADFNEDDRVRFYFDVRNGLLHAGETVDEWKVNKDQATLLNEDQATRTRAIIDPDKFHAGVESEFERLLSDLRDGPAAVREHFTRRMDTICGWPLLYFAYGSNLLPSEIQKKTVNVHERGNAFISGYRLAFSKHSEKWRGDAASIIRTYKKDDQVWGAVYGVDFEGRKTLMESEDGYREQMVNALLQNTDGSPGPLVRAFTFSGKTTCHRVGCAPSLEYVDVILRGAKQKKLPERYVQVLRSLAEATGVRHA